MRILMPFLCASLFLAPVARSDDQHHHELTAEEVGSVQFATSCSKTVSVNFNRAVALLHSFQYEQARQAFNEISARDPQCAMAQWGVAMSHYHGLWHNGDASAGRKAIVRAKAIAAANPKTTPREMAYLDALSEIYGEDGKDQEARDRAFEQKMGAVQAAYPDDSEAAIFHAFTHYIIHCYDNAVLAENGLGAARMYAKIAPVSAHANHMPSHLFTRVGSWDESIASNMKSA